MSREQTFGASIIVSVDPKDYRTFWSRRLKVDANLRFGNRLFLDFGQSQADYLLDGRTPASWR